MSEKLYKEKVGDLITHCAGVAIERLNDPTPGGQRCPGCKIEGKNGVCPMTDLMKEIDRLYRLIEE